MNDIPSERIVNILNWLVKHKVLVEQSKACKINLSIKDTHITGEIIQLPDIS